MKTNDQHFEPGDKVMRVSHAQEMGLEVTVGAHPKTGFGVILCVLECFEADGFNWVRFVGIPCAHDEAWYARCFRCVEEIKLCVHAAERTRLPAETVHELSEIQN